MIYKLLFRGTTWEKCRGCVKDKTRCHDVEVSKRRLGMINPGREDDMERYDGEDDVIND